MKKIFAALMALTVLLTLTACGTKKTEPEKTEQPSQQETQPETLPELSPAEPVELTAERVEGRLPEGEYDLPDEVTSMLDWQWSGAVALLAEEDGAEFYAVEGKESSVALLYWDGVWGEFDWLFVTPRAIDPQLWVTDIDEDGEDELVALCYGGSGTGVSLEYLYVVEREGKTLVSYELPLGTLSQALNGQLQTVSVNGTVYAALGRELVDITADLEGVKTENVSVCLGQTAAYRPTESGLTCTFGVVAEGDGIPFLSCYVAEVEGEIRYADGIFTLENLRLSDI